MSYSGVAASRYEVLTNEQTIESVRRGGESEGLSNRRGGSDFIESNEKNDDDDDDDVGQFMHVIRLDSKSNSGVANNSANSRLNRTTQNSATSSNRLSSEEEQQLRVRETAVKLNMYKHDFFVRSCCPKLTHMVTKQTKFLRLILPIIVTKSKCFMHHSIA